MLALRRIVGVGYSASAPTEFQAVVSTVSTPKPPLVYCHGANDTMATVFTKSGQSALVKALAQEYTVIVADLGFQVWGNDVHISRIADAKAYLASVGSTGPLTLVGTSMGALGALGYARENSVRAVAGVIPGLDLADLRDKGFSAEIDGAYGGAYSDAVHGPEHSPVRYASTLACPIHLFTASNDLLTVPSTADEFVSERPKTLRTNLGALGHTEPAISAAVVPVVRWLRKP